MPRRRRFVDEYDAVHVRNAGGLMGPLKIKVNAKNEDDKDEHADVVILEGQGLGPGSKNGQWRLREVTKREVRAVKVEVKRGAEMVVDEEIDMSDLVLVWKAGTVKGAKLRFPSNTILFESEDGIHTRRGSSSGWNGDFVRESKKARVCACTEEAAHQLCTKYRELLKVKIEMRDAVSTVEVDIGGNERVRADRVAEVEFARHRVAIARSRLYVDQEESEGVRLDVEALELERETLAASVREGESLVSSGEIQLEELERDACVQEGVLCTLEEKYARKCYLSLHAAKATYNVSCGMTVNTSCGGTIANLRGFDPCGEPPEIDEVNAATVYLARFADICAYYCSVSHGPYSIEFCDSLPYILVSALHMGENANPSHGKMPLYLTTSNYDAFCEGYSALVRYYALALNEVEGRPYSDHPPTSCVFGLISRILDALSEKSGGPAIESLGSV